MLGSVFNGWSTWENPQNLQVSLECFLTSIRPFDRVKLSPKLTGIFDHFSLGWRRFDEDFSLPFRNCIGAMGSTDKE